MPDGGRLSPRHDRRSDLAGRARQSCRPATTLRLAVSDTGTGMRAGGARAPLRAVLHHQGARPGAPAWARDGPRHRAPERRQHPGGERAGAGHALRRPLAPGRRGGARPPRLQLARAGAARGGSEVVLLVEDEDNIREPAVEILESAGLPGARRAGRRPRRSTLAEGHPGPIHILVTDVVMPGMSGSQLAQRAHAPRGRRSGCSTSRATPRTAISHHGVLDGGQHFLLQKPFPPGQFLEKVSARCWTTPYRRTGRGHMTPLEKEADPGPRIARRARRARRISGAGVCRPAHGRSGVRSAGGAVRHDLIVVGASAAASRRWSTSPPPGPAGRRPRRPPPGPHGQSALPAILSRAGPPAGLPSRRRREHPPGPDLRRPARPAPGDPGRTVLPLLQRQRERPPPGDRRAVPLGGPRPTAPGWWAWCSPATWTTAPRAWRRSSGCGGTAAGAGPRRGRLSQHADERPRDRRSRPRPAGRRDWRRRSRYSPARP